MNAIYDLATEVERMGQWEPEYYEKMIHRVPLVPSISREIYLTDKAKGQVMIRDLVKCAWQYYDFGPEKKCSR